MVTHSVGICRTGGYIGYDGCRQMQVIGNLCPDDNF